MFYIFACQFQRNDNIVPISTEPIMIIRPKLCLNFISMMSECVWLHAQGSFSISARIDIIESHSESQIHRRANRPMWYAAEQRANKHLLNALPIIT